MGLDAARGRDAELIWCDDVSRLQKALSADGGSLLIERKLQLESIPLKRGAISSGGSEVHSIVPSSKSKSLRE